MVPAREPFGFINALKPPGPTSTSFGGWVRRLLGGVAIGHWGTLDPAACGVLVLSVGRASRLLPFLPDARKRYVFEMRVGLATDTGDATGRAIARAGVPSDWAARLRPIADDLVGSLDQVPPMYSAVKIDGRPLYKAARAGRVIERAARRVHIYGLRVLGVSGTTARLSVECSGGTYVRTLCEQIGERLGLPAHLGMLLRTAAGPFGLDESMTPAQLKENPSRCIFDPLGVLTLPRVELTDPAAKRFANGNPVDRPDGAIALAPDSNVLVLRRGELIGVGSIGDMLLPVRVLIRSEKNP